MSGILFLADPHVGMTEHDGPDGNGNPSWREQEAIRVLNAAVDEANARDAAIVVAGDLFHHLKPPAWAYKAVGSSFARAKKYVHVIGGNHDTTETHGATSPLDVLRGFPNINVVSSPKVHDIGGFDLMFLPWFGRAKVEAVASEMGVRDQYDYMQQAVARIIASLVPLLSGKRPAVLVMHGTVSGAEYNSGTQPMLGESSEFMFPLMSVALDVFEFVIAGHVHKPQAITGGACPVICPGSSARRDFGEESQTCRVLYAEPGWEPQEILMPATEFETFEVDARWTSFGQRMLTGKVVRIKGELPAGTETAALMSDMNAAFAGMEPLRVAKPAITYVRHEQRARMEMTTTMTPLENLEKFMDIVGGEYETRHDEVLVLHEEVSTDGVEW